MRFGAQLWSQATDWPSFRDAALAADANGWDSIWTWDHLLAIFGPWEQPIFEGWTSLAAIAPLTRKARLGLMVGANTFRQPGLTAKLATTLDHVSGGRAVLGLGGAWFDREHDAFGIEFGASPGERLRWLDESVTILRRLLDGERVTHDGPRYRLKDAICEPRPVQAHLPILIGGSGRQKTLRIVAERADAWNTSGELADAQDAVRVLSEHCAAVGRDIATIERTVSFPIVIRDSAAAADTAMAAILANNGVQDMGPVPHLLGEPERIADAIRPFADLGFTTVIVRLGAPYDHETLERISEVAELLP